MKILNFWDLGNFILIRAIAHYYCGLKFFFQNSFKTWPKYQCWLFGALDRNGGIWGAHRAKCFHLESYFLINKAFVWWRDPKFCCWCNGHIVYLQKRPIKFRLLLWKLKGNRMINLRLVFYFWINKFRNCWCRIMLFRNHRGLEQYFRLYQNERAFIIVIAFMPFF